MGYIKLERFLYLWDSRNDEKYFSKKDWTWRKTFIAERFNFDNVPLLKKNFDNFDIFNFDNVYISTLQQCIPK